MKYIDRRGTNCMKWDGLNDMFGAPDLLALWVADMDFEIAGCITDAVRAYFEHGAPGYYRVPDSYYEAFIKWEMSEHGLAVEREHMRFAPGVVPALYWLVQMLTQPDDAIAVMMPVYYPFMSAVTDNGRRLVSSDLIDTEAGWWIDFDDLEKKIAANDVRLLILCSPHNPVGRVWHRDELENLLAVCRRHGVTILSDEIHHDLVFGGARHIPLLSLAGENDCVVMLTAASKTFNIASLQNSVIVIPDDELRAAWDSFVKCISAGSGNAVGYVAAEAAWRGGKSWLEDARAAIYDNYLWLKGELAAHLPEARVAALEGTYLCWIDLGAYVSADQLEAVVRDDCRLAVDFGEWFVNKDAGADAEGVSVGSATGGEGGTPADGAPAVGGAPTSIRVNLATSRENIETAAQRLTDRLG